MYKSVGLMYAVREGRVQSDLVEHIGRSSQHYNICLLKLLYDFKLLWVAFANEHWEISAYLFDKLLLINWNLDQVSSFFLQSI